MSGRGARRDEAPGEPRIEHACKREVIKTLDLGSDGGDKGGEVLAEGTPEDVAKEPRSYPGGYLIELLARSVPAQAPDAPVRRKRGSSASLYQREAAE